MPNHFVQKNSKVWFIKKHLLSFFAIIQGYLHASLKTKKHMVGCFMSMFSSREFSIGVGNKKNSSDGKGYVRWCLGKKQKTVVNDLGDLDKPNKTFTFVHLKDYSILF